jgi:hypothetical protein
LDHPDKPGDDERGGARMTGLCGAHTIVQASSKDSRGRRGAGSSAPWPMEQTKFERMAVPAKNSASTPALLKPYIGPASSPSARAARIR